MKLHIGCGKKYLEGFKHVDTMVYPHIDFNATADNLTMIENETVEEIYACHILEHIGRHEVNTVLKEWQRVLKPKGILRLAVPNFEAIVEYYNETKDLPKLLGCLYGGQNYEYNFHYMTYDFTYLKLRLEENGYEKVQRYEWKDFLPTSPRGGFDDYSRSYLPHMDFEHGKLMSLNVCANKI